MFDFKNMTVIVTGSGAGMGREAAKLFAAYGANVVVNSRSGTCEDARAEIEAAGGSYLYPQNDTGRSLPISTEQAMLLARRADVWLNVGQLTSLDELRRACPKFAKASSVTGGRVYNNNLRRGPHGGSDFWESGAVYPSRILADLMAIFYPSAEHGELYYYRHLK